MELMQSCTEPSISYHTKNIIIYPCPIRTILIKGTHERNHPCYFCPHRCHVQCIPKKLHRVLFCYKLLWLYFALLVDIHPYSPAWWRHQMETFSALLALCAGNSPVPVNSPHKGQWRGALMFSLIYAWINDWANNREAGDLRRHRGHYDVIVMGYSTGTGTLVPVKYIGGISVKFTYQNWYYITIPHNK